MKKELDITDLVEMISSSSRVFDDIQVFSRDFFHGKIFHRSDELSEIIHHITPDKSFHIIISGDDGVGKTTIGRMLLTIMNDADQHDVNHYMSALNATEYGMLREIADAVGIDKLPRSKSSVMSALRSDENKICVILDDVMWNDQVNSFFSHIYHLANISTISLSTNKASSSIMKYMPAEIRLQGYSQNQVMDILEYRVIGVGGFCPDILETEELMICANIVTAQLSGNIQDGIDILYKSGMLLERDMREGRDIDRITEDHILEAYDELFGMSDGDIQFEDAFDIILIILVITGGSCPMARLLRMCNSLRSQGVYVPSKSTVWRYIKKLHAQRYVIIASMNGKVNAKRVQLRKSSEYIMKVIEKKRGRQYLNKLVNTVKRCISK